jgi:membrane-bound lytic murein transglycosylase B
MLGKSLEAKFTLDEFTRAGVSANDSLPNSISYGLVDLQDGERPTLYWLGTANFFAIAQYNRSFFYAMTVIELGKAVRQQRQYL